MLHRGNTAKHGRVVPTLTRRRWGYLVWAVALGFVFVPEILAALPFTESQLPFPTISKMTGHLEYVNAAWELVPTMAIVFVLYSLLRIPVRENSGGQTAETIAERRNRGDNRPHRTPAGRLTFREAAEPTESYDNRVLGYVRFGLRSVAIAIVITALTLLAYHHWPTHYNTVDGKPHKLPNYPVAYVLYGSIAFFWLVLPSLRRLITGTDADHPSLFRTIFNLEDWIGKRRANPARNRLGKALAWLVTFILIWGMVFLMLHLTLYPFPNITHILNPQTKTG